MSKMVNLRCWDISSIIALILHACYDDTMKLHSLISGSGKDLVLLTGLAGSTRYWDHMMPAFEAAGYRVIRLDLLGFAKSPRPRTITYDLDTHLAALEETLAEIDITNAVIVGYSVSCSLVLALTARHPEWFSRAVLICPAFYGSFKVADARAYRTGDLPRWILDSNYARIICRVVCENPLLAIPAYRLLARSVPAAVRNDARKHHWQSYRQTFDNLILHFKPQPLVAVMTVPSLVIYGDKDASADDVYLRSLPQANPVFKIKLVIGAHHQVPNQFPDVIARLITHGQ
jgi:pimeloyl-ACP methyl ester carboxylesterase